MTEIYGFHPGKKSILSFLSVTTKIILVNIIAFIVFEILIITKVISFETIALTPSNALQGKYLWTFLTSMFMHAGIAHIFFNMFSLAFIGSFVERLIGRKRFFWFYIFAGIFAGIVFISLAGFFGSGFGEKIFGNPDIPGVGASGAIFGLLGLLAMLVPYSKVYLILGPLVAIVLDAILGNMLPGGVMTIFTFLVNIYFIISIFAIFSFSDRFRQVALPVGMPFWLLPFVAIVPLVIIGIFVPLPIGNMAHFGGLIAGLAYGAYLRKKYQKKTKYLRNHFR